MPIRRKNAVAALRALEILNEQGYPTTLVQRQDGLKRTTWPGRFALLGTEPDFVVDGAHNPAAADMLAASIERYFKEKGSSTSWECSVTRITARSSRNRKIRRYHPDDCGTG